MEGKNRLGLALLALVLGLVIGGIGVSLFTTDDEPTKPKPAPSATPAPAETPEATPTPDTVPGDLQVLPEKPSDPVTKDPADSALRDSTPETVPEQKLEDGAEKSDEISEGLEPKPVGGAQNYDCRQDFSGGVYSDRSASPTEWVNHYTVSANVAGWGDVEGIQAYFKRTRIASATYIVDFEGHCLQMVPESKKPWTQGSANSWAISVEIIATGSETKQQWLDSPLIKQGILSSIARDAMRRHGIPLKRVDPVGCVFVAGWTDHNALECGNNHTDVSPNFPYATFQKQLTDGVKVPITSRHRDTCKKISAYRHGKRDDKKNQAKRIKFIRSADLHCVKGKPVRNK